MVSGQHFAYFKKGTWSACEKFSLNARISRKLPFSPNLSLVNSLLTEFELLANRMRKEQVNGLVIFNSNL